MILSVVKTGNTGEIRIPSELLTICKIEDEVDVELLDGKIILSAHRNPREGWDKAFKEKQEEGDDESLCDANLDAGEDWTW